MLYAVAVFVRVYDSQCTQWNGTRPVSCALSASCLERPTGCACIFKGDLTVCLCVCGMMTLRLSELNIQCACACFYIMQ